MSDIKTKYGTAGVAVTITLASLASAAAAGRESTVVDNTTNLFLDALVMLQVTLQAGTPANDKAVYVYAYGTADADTPIYPDAVTGADAAITLRDPTTLKLIGVIPTPTGGVSYRSMPMSVAAAFGGVVPRKWGIVVRNYTGIALSATESDHKKVYQGVLGSVV